MLELAIGAGTTKGIPMSQSTPDDGTPDDPTPNDATHTPTTMPATPPADPAPAGAPTATAAATPASTGRRPLPRWVPITGLAVVGALLLGLVFNGGVAVGRFLPDHRGPAGIAMGGNAFDRGERGGQDLRDRGPSGGDGLTREQREQFRDEMIERWQELQQENG